MRNEIILRSEQQRKYAMEFLASLKLDPEKPFVLKVETLHKKRSLSQLALLWVRHNEVAKYVAEHTGYSAEDVHDYLKQRFLSPKIVEINGHVSRRYTTKDLTLAEMSEFMNKIEAWASSELGILLPSPEDRRVA